MTLIILILILGILIFIHELGHFIFAKLTGVYVHEFALGMGPKIFSYQRKNKKDPTLYSIRLLPIGGFCAMAGEVGEEEEENKKIKKSEYLCNKSKKERFAILIAGVAFNFILAIILLFIQSLIWGHTEQRSVVGLVKEGYPIAEAGIETGDRVLEINGRDARSWDKLTIILNLKHKEESYIFKVEKKSGEIKEYEITPATETNEDGDEIKVFGIGAGETIYKGIWKSVKYAFSKFWSIITTMALIISSLITGKLGLSSLSGPVGMYSIVGESAKYGMQSLIYLTAYLSVNLGFINAIPFPAFDGGRILFIIVEWITKKKVNASVEGMFHTIGFILLMLLMVYITIMDVIKLF